MKKQQTQARLLGPIHAMLLSKMTLGCSHLNLKLHISPHLRNQVGKSDTKFY
jgi:hypothetical protein